MKTAMHPARDTETKEQTEEITNSISTPLPSKSNKKESVAQQGRGIETNEKRKYFTVKRVEYFSVIYTYTYLSFGTC